MVKIDIREYLRIQEDLNTEMSNLLKQLSTVEAREKEILYTENNKLLDKLEISRRTVVEKSIDGLSQLRIRVKRLAITNREEELGLTAEVEELISLIVTLEDKLVTLENRVKSASFSNEEPTIINKPEVVNTPIEPKVNTVKINQPVTKKDGTGLKMGVGALNLVGILLVLISLSTFGRYVYVNFMSDGVKGIVLFLIPILILLSGEMYFSKKSYKFSKGISALGVSGLYVALIINYLSLNNINGIVALLGTTLITGGAIYLSYRKESNLLRVVTLLGAYISLIPLDKVSLEQSFILVAIVTAINIMNIYLPLKDVVSKNVSMPFALYTSILALFFPLMVVITMDSKALVVLLIATTLVYSVQYIINCTLKASILNSIGILMYFTIYPLITLIIVHLEFTNSIGNGVESLLVNSLILAIYCAIGLTILYCVKNKGKWTGYVGFVLSSLVIVADIAIFGYSSYVVALVALNILTLVLFVKTKEKMLLVTLIGLTSMCILGYVITFTDNIGLVYLVSFAVVLYELKEYKNNILIILGKYAYMLLIILKVAYEISDISVLQHFQSFILLGLSVGLVVVINEVDILRHDGIKALNLLSFCAIGILSILCGLIGSTEFYLTTLLIVHLLVFMCSERYIETSTLKSSKTLIYAVLASYIVVRLSFISDIGNQFKQLILSISLMLVALGSVGIGFKINDSKLRKYGLILSLGVCAKLIIVDFYSFEFITKTIVAMVVGLIALAISFTFSKLEKELKNK